MKKPNSKACSKVTLYYDGACSLCTREMNILNKYADASLCLQDIHTLNDSELKYIDRQDKAKDIPSKKDLLLYLHAKTEDGRWVIGADANVLAWQYTKFGMFFKVLRWPLVAPIVDWIYDIWAKQRFERNKERGLYKHTDIAE